jgi:hypothetical protein
MGMSKEQFHEQWDLATIPACNKGIELLRHFAEAHPNAYQFVRPEDFVELDNPAFAMIPEWDAFARHCATCPKCHSL